MANLSDLLKAGLGQDGSFEAEIFDARASFKAFALGNDSELDEAAAERLVNIVFDGTPRLVLGYDETRIQVVLERWFADLENSGVQANVISRLRAEVISIESQAEDRDLKSGLVEAGIQIRGIEMRSNPSDKDFAKNGGGKRAARVNFIHAAVRDAAAAQGLLVVGNSEPDVRDLLVGAIDHLAELRDLQVEVSGLRVPRTLSYDEQLAAQMLPVVIKKTTGSRGVGKYLIRNAEQWKTFVKWVEAKSMQEEVRNHWLFQEYIETPAGRPTSLRVFVDCVGKIMGTQLFYGPKFTDGKKILARDRADEYKNDPEVDLEDPEGEFFLDSDLIASNKRFLLDGIDVPRTPTYRDSKGDEFWSDSRPVYTDPKTGKKVYTHRVHDVADTVREDVFREVNGRINVGFKKGKFVPNNVERELLLAHGFDPDVPRLPSKLTAQAQAVARRLAFDRDREGLVTALYLGLDFVKEPSGEWCFLEANRRADAKAVKERELLDRDPTIWVVERIIERLGAFKNLTI